MNKCLKTVLCTGLLVVMLLSIAACGSKVTGLEETYVEWKTDVSSRNKEAASSQLISYGDLKTAATADKKQSSKYLSLNGTWDFAYTQNAASVPTNFMKLDFVYPDPNATGPVSSKTEILYWDDINVPGTFEMQGYGTPVYQESAYAWSSDIRPSNVPETNNPIGLYRRSIAIPADWDGSEIYITLDGVSSACYVYVNGEMVGYGQDTYTSKSFRITDFVTAGEEALVAVKVFKYSYASWIEAQDVIKFGGIFRDVYLSATPKVTIKDISIDPGLDEELINATMLVNVDVASYVEPKSGYTLEIQVLDQDGGVYLANRRLGSEVTFKATKDTGSNYYAATAGGRVGAEAPIKWTAETPYLYTAIVTLKDADGAVVDIKSVRFGYSNASYTVDDEGNQSFLMNGQPVKLYGVVYNEFNAATGSYVTYEQKVEDVKALKAMNVNAVRSPGVPFSSEFVDLCAEYGLYIVSDINLESEPYSSKGDSTIPGDQTIWQNILVDRLYSVVERDKNSPAVIMWGLGNESGEGSSFKALRSVLQGLDDRLIIYDGDSRYSDLLVANDWSYTKLNDALNNADNKKPILLESFDMALLNGGGNIASLVDLVDTNHKVQGGFFGYFIDKALYWPKDSANAASILKDKPYSSNSGEYQLTYSGSWGESMSDSYKGLTGLLSANRIWQPEAYEYKNAFSPIAVTAVDVKNGKFAVTNRLDFTAFENAYEIVYEIYKEAELVSSGTVSGLSLEPGATAEITIPYGSLAANVDYFVDIKVKNLEATKWDDLTNGVVAAWQYDITGLEALPLTGGAESDFGSALNVTIVEKPDVMSTVIDIVTGDFYVSNNAPERLADLYDCTFELIETNNFWENPRPVVISTGTVDLSAVGAYAQNVKLHMNYDNEQKAVEGGDYLVKVKFTAKKDMGDVPAGYVLVWNFNAETLGAPIPFEVDLSRSPVPAMNDDGTPMIDEKGNPVMEGGDPEPETVPEVDINDEALSDQQAYDPYTLIENDRVKILVDNDSGTIIKFAIDGEDVFANSSSNSSPEFVLYRNPTGGDRLSDVTSKENSGIVSLSRNNSQYHKLVDSIKVNQIAANHYQLVLDYVLVTYDYALFSSETTDTKLTVTYDFFGNGEMVISYAYDPTVLTGIPSEIGNIIVLDEGYDTFSWYGRGPGESYVDRLADTRVSVYEDVEIGDMVSTRYIYNSGTGDRTNVRWLTVDGDEKTKLLITSTTSNFAFNVSYTNGLSSSAYARDIKSGDVFLRLIAEQRGVSAGNLVDANTSVLDSIIEPGQYVEFSYRIKPISDSDSAMDLAKTYISVNAPKVDKEAIVSGADYSITSVASGVEYVTVKDGSVLVEGGHGSDTQLWKITDNVIPGFNTSKIDSLGCEGILSPAYAVFAPSTTSVELGIGDFHVSRHWATWELSDDGQLKNLSIQWPLAPLSDNNGTHVVLRRPEDVEGSTSAMWEYVPVDEENGIYAIQNKKTKSYLTVIDEISYRNAIVDILADRKLNYYGDVDWTQYSALSKPRLTESDGSWVKLRQGITLWNLLPDASQTWTFTAVADGEYRITNKNTGLALTYDGVTLSEQAVSGNANQTWKVIEDNGVYGIVNKANNGALTIEPVRTLLSEDELAAIYVEKEDDKYKDVNAITVKPWAGLATQKWDLQSDEDKKIIIEAGEDWFSAPAAAVEE
ncbi:MAG: RICIN domain-containing protein [Clostridia bacterium]|nr:RICIN domain-containing protein [Clostridia bacterium]